jgi:hypothetical protein
VQEFSIEIQSIDWKMLAPHQKRGDLLIVDAALDLVEVGQAIAGDEAGKVKQWLAQSQLLRPTSEQISAWEKTDEEIFSFVIVKPFVLAQLKTKN